MKKNFTFLMTLLLSPVAFTQVGINTTAPKATLEVIAQNSTGNSSKPEGVLITRFDRERAQSMINVPVSMLIYIDDITSGTQTGTAVYIDTPGFYYYNGIAWIKLNTSDRNLYDTDGTLEENRTVDSGSYSLSFQGIAKNAFSVDNDTFSIDAEDDRVGIGTISPSAKLDVIGNNMSSPIRVRNMENSDTTLRANKSDLAPVVIDNNGVMVRQFSPVSLGDSYSLDGEFMAHADTTLTTIFTNVEFNSLVLFKFITNMAFGQDNTAFLYSQVSFSGKNGFQVGSDWSYTGISTSPKVNVIGAGTSVLVFDFNTGADLIFRYDENTKSIRVQKNMDLNNPTDAVVHIYEGKKIW